MNTSKNTIRFSSVLQSLPDTIPFVAPEELERNRGALFDARLGANESAFGISPKATLALQDAIGIAGCSWYGDPLSYNVKQRLCERIGISTTELCVDAGIDSLLGLTVRLFMEPGSVMVTSRGAYPTVNYHVIGVGGIVHAVPYKNNHEDTEALALAANVQNARLVYLANPDNPMGTRVSASAIQALINQLPEQCVLMLDEAYYEFMPEDDVLSVNTSVNNVIRFRTFSKAYGMAGMRIGYAFGNESLIRGYDKIRNHFGVNKLAQIAATASLEDTEMLPKIKNAVHTGRERIYAMAANLDLPYIESFTNFVAVDLGSSDRAFKMLGLLNEHGVFMRKPMQPPQDRYLRVGVGTDSEHAVLQKVLPALLKELV
ncbi:MAG: histidinol-phosphate aminotransferase [Patiriisocius sp.]|jgi:histidinol-phosphate aminotransferase